METRLKNSSLITIVVGSFVALMSFAGVISKIFTDILWFDQLGFLSVYLRANGAKVILTLFGFAITFLLLFINLYIPFKKRPILAPDSYARYNLKGYQLMIDKTSKIFLVVIPAIIAFIGSGLWGSQWDKFFLWWNSTSFNKTDPEFNIDLSFYINKLPLISFVINYLLFFTVLSFGGALVTHYIFGAIRLDKNGFFAFKKTKIHLGILSSFIMLLLSFSFFIERYSSLNKQSGRSPGALYVDINAVIPTQGILALLALIISVFFIFSTLTEKWTISIISTSMLLVTSIFLSNLYPWILQRFFVQPSELTMEREYIQRNIDSTRSAYGIDNIDSIKYNAKTNIKTESLKNDLDTTQNIRLLDPSLVSPSFAQLEQYRQYYSFSPNLDVDRYIIDGKQQDIIIAARELNVEAAKNSQNNWYNQHIVYTHGYGLVGAYGNKRADDGKPVFVQHGIPSQGKLGEYEPRIYFGEKSPDYSIVGGSNDSPPKELDYPQDGDNKSEANTTYKGNGGPILSNFFIRLAYAIKFGSEKILLSDAVNNKSQILYDRNPADRVKAVAPFLIFDKDPYPAIIDGKVKWIIDGYTTSNNYPYATKQSLDQESKDIIKNTQDINYIRNSVKATVDSYDGSIEIYGWDTSDPLLKTWEKSFPGSIKSIEDMSSELIQHVRYPEDLFKIQRSLISTYHVKNADELYSRQDAWQLPNDPGGNSQEKESIQSPYYLTLKMPGQEKSAFSLTSSFIPQQSGSNTRNVLTGFVAADSDAGSEKGKKSEHYGKIRLLELPRDTVVPGPGQVQNNFNADPTVSQALNLLRQGSSKVQNGNLLTLPVANGLLYVQPVYVRSSGETSYPLLQKVLVAFGDKIGFASTLDEALNQLFEGNSGIDYDSIIENSKSLEKGNNKHIEKHLYDAFDFMKQSKDRLSKGDFAGYGESQKKLQESIEKAVKIQENITNENRK